MLKWHFSAFQKETVEINEDFSYDELVELRSDLISLHPILIVGELRFDGKKGFFCGEVSVHATVIAANTGAHVSYEEIIHVKEPFLASDEEYVNLAEETIDVQRFVQSIVDLAIPSYVTEELTNESQQEGTYWSLIEESDYYEKQSVDQTSNKLSNLSDLLAEKNK